MNDLLGLNYGAFPVEVGRMLGAGGGGIQEMRGVTAAPRNLIKERHCSAAGGAES